MRTVAATLIGLTLCLAGCQANKAAESNESMTLDQVPAKVRQSINTESDTPVESINRHEYKGNVVYSTVGTTAGKSYDIEVDEEGRLLRRAARPTAQ
jgi:hypothetical protein